MRYINNYLGSYILLVAAIAPGSETGNPHDRYLEVVLVLSKGKKRNKIEKCWMYSTAFPFYVCPIANLSMLDMNGELFTSMNFSFPFF